MTRQWLGRRSANRGVTLAGDSVIRLPADTTTYTGVISGFGTLRLVPAGGTSNPSTLVITRTSTFTLPVAQQVQVVKKTSYPGAGYALTITGLDPPVLTIDPGVTFQIGTNTSADSSPNIIATSDSRNDAGLINGEINLNNILNNGTIVLNSMQFVLLGQVSGSGSIVQAVNAWGGMSSAGVSPYEGVLSLTTGQDFGSNHRAVSLPNAKAILNEGSLLMWSPPGSVVTVKQNIYEAAYGNDINFHAIGPSTIVMSGVYSHTDNSPHNTPSLVNPGLSDPSLNFAKTIYRGGANAVNGNDASYRGINIEPAAGTVQWGDGTHANFFLPAAPSPAEVDPPLGKKNAYINLRGGNLAFNYNGPVTLHVGITGGGGGPHRDGSVGSGNVTVMATPGNDVTFAQPQNYNGTTTIGANAIVNDGQLIVQNTSTAITLSNISGSGTLTHDGAAALTLRNNRYSGATTLNAGTTLAGSADAFGTGSVVNNAVPALAGGQHELTLGGAFRQGAAGQLTLAIAGTTPGLNHDHLTVAGATVLGGSLVLNFSGSVAKGQKLVLINAAGGITGAFSSISSTGATVVGGQDGTSFFVTVQ